MADPCKLSHYSFISLVNQRNYQNINGGSYGNTSKDRIKDTLAKANFLLDDHVTGGPGSGIGDAFSASGANKDLAGYAYGGNDYKMGGDRNSSTGLQMARGSSMPPTTYGYAKSNYTASEFDSENETHS